MPYSIKYDKSKDKPWRVINKDTGKDKGGSETREMAIRHMKAMYAEEK